MPVGHRCHTGSTTTTSGGLGLGVPAGGPAPKGRAGFEVERIGYCSGVLSQKLTAILRTVSRRTSFLVGWGVTLPFRWVPPVFDNLATAVTK